MIELKPYKKPMLILLSVILLFVVILLNFKSVGRAPELVRLSKSVAYPGDTISLYGNYFGGEISKGRVTINGQLVFRSNIVSWSDKEITLTLLKDFKSGMITVKNMFGESESHLITSYNDVPTVKTSEEITGFPFIESIDNLDGPESKYVLAGRNFGVRQNLSTLVVSNNNENDGDGFSEIPKDCIVSWSDDSIEFYLPFGLKSSVIYVKSSKGFSNYFNLPEEADNPVSYNFSSSKNYKLRQRVTIEDVITLMGSSIGLFIPCPEEGLNQKNITLNSREGFYNKDTNTYNYILNVNETGESFSVELESSIDVYRVRTDVDINLVGRKYDTVSPNYKIGFQTTPGVLYKDRDIKNTSVWLAKKSKNPYIQAEEIIKWIVKYIKLDSEGASLSSAAFKNRKGSEDGLVKLTVSMLRSAGIPSRVVKGIVINDGNSRNYSWTEFLLPGGAWVTVDIIEFKKNSSYEIGSLTNNKVAFSRGIKYIEYQNDSFRDDIYVLQNSVSYFSGNVESYNAVWHNVEIE